MKKLLIIALLFVSFVICAEEFEPYEFEEVNFDKFTEVHTKVTGEAINNTDEFHELIIFKISVYDENEVLIDTANILIPEFKANDKTTFDCFITNTTPDEIYYYLIERHL